MNYQTIILRLFKGACCLLVFAAMSLQLTTAQASLPDYQLFEDILNNYVNDNGRVNYQGLKANRLPLDQFIKDEVEGRDISALSDNQKKAFWINAYNALTLRLIIDNYPLRFGGIRTINWGRPWDVKMKVTNQELTLNHIEHEILRKWNPIDPRIHFAINCASIGCPKIPNTHFNSEILDEQLEKESIKFINDVDKVRLDRSKNILFYSAILSWFEQDFLSVSPDKLSFILKYLNEEDKKYILSNTNQIQLKKMKYDWGLNKQK